MCGIAGIFSYHASAPGVDREILLRIRDSMQSRGPDGEGLWLSGDGRVGLAHRRLSIIDLSELGAQPMSLGEDYKIVFNGEIYNYRELRDRLEKKGCRFKSTSDTEVLLYMYAEFGTEMIHMLRGMFAFAIWDNRRGGIFLVRDVFGIKPLYVSDDGATLHFASQVKALLRSGCVNMAPEPAGHVGFFLWGYVPDPYTLYKGIRSLPAGSGVWIDRSGRRTTTRMSGIPEIFLEAQDTSSRIAPQEMHDRLRGALGDSVRRHMVSDVPVGVFLSSGLDSATVLAHAVESGDIPQSITLGFREYLGSDNDEVPMAARIAGHYGSGHHTQWISKEDFRGVLDHFMVSMDQPSIDGLNTFLVSQVAATCGMKVAMSGLGGDELFGGYPSFHDIPRMVKWLGVGRHFPVFGRIFRCVAAPLLEHFTSTKYAGILEYGGTPGGAYLLRRGLFMPWDLNRILDPELVRDGWGELQVMTHLNGMVGGLTNTHLIVSALEMKCYMRSQLLRDADWAGMAHSLEIRVPFVDLDLLREVAPLLMQPKPPTKRDMANTPGKALPSEVLSRRKTGFSVPVRDWAMDTLKNTGMDRGLRGWAQIIYEKHCESVLGTA